MQNVLTSSPPEYMNWSLMYYEHSPIVMKYVGLKGRSFRGAVSCQSKSSPMDCISTPASAPS